MPFFLCFSIIKSVFKSIFLCHVFSSCSSQASSVEWRTQWRASFLPGCRNTSRMETLLQDRQDKEQSRTANQHLLLLLLMVMKRDLLPLMDATPQSQAPVIQARGCSSLLCYIFLKSAIFTGVIYFKAHLWFLPHLQNPRPAEHPWTFRSMCFLDHLWVVLTSILPRWMLPPLQWGPPAASSLRPPLLQPLAPSPQASHWSKKLRTTSRNTKTITSPPRVGSPPVHLTRVGLEYIGTF